MAAQPLIIGLTGNIATGKSTVLAYLAERGAHVIDADKVTHRVLAPDGLAYANVVDTFGPGVVSVDGAIDRAALGTLVFSDPHALQQLERIVHPAVLQSVRDEVASSSAKVVTLEAIKLIEAGSLITLCDEVWVVTADPEIQHQRLQEERGMGKEEAEKRMAAQSSQDEKVRHAQRVIENNGMRDALFSQLDHLWEELWGRYPDRLAGCQR